MPTPQQQQEPPKPATHAAEAEPAPEPELEAQPEPETQPEAQQEETWTPAQPEEEPAPEPEVRPSFCLMATCCRQTCAVQCAGRVDRLRQWACTALRTAGSKHILIAHISGQTIMAFQMT